jgi:DNA-binding NarL/FixJ family response regulator
VAGGGEAAGVRERAGTGPGSGATATDREIALVAAVIAAGSGKAAAHRLGQSHSTVKHHLANARSKVGAATTAQPVWNLGPWLPRPEDVASGSARLSAITTP